jgi:hypothetical protein
MRSPIEVDAFVEECEMSEFEIFVERLHSLLYSRSAVELVET